MIWKQVKFSYRLSLSQVKETFFLGVVLDEHLSWKPHISQVARKISKQ